MHEMSIAQSLIDIIQEEMDRHQATSLRSVRLNIGQLSAVVPESLSFCFEVITTGTPLEGAELIMNMVPLTGACRSCGETFEIENYAFTCPKCDSPEIDTVSGQDLSIVEMEVD
jgi:hydrogenase nickel incorporation protein HypA/HybF